MDNIVNLVLNFLKEAGEIAIAYQNNLSASIKKDKTIVTEADIKISNIFNERIKNFLNNGNHKILDEEKLPNLKEFFNNNTEYLWTIDPIDGTTTYFYGFNLWAIGISLYKNYEPYMGFIYMPSTKEIVYTDGIKSYYIKDAFTKLEDKKELLYKDAELINKSVVLQHRLKGYNINKLVVLDLYSSYVLAFYTLIGKGVATFFNPPMKLWDITATIPIAKNIGLDFINIKNNKRIISLKDISLNEEMTLEDTYVMCNKNIYDKLKNELFN